VALFLICGPRALTTSGETVQAASLFLLTSMACDLMTEQTRFMSKRLATQTAHEVHHWNYFPVWINNIMRFSQRLQSIITLCVLILINFDWSRIWWRFLCQNKHQNVFRSLFPMKFSNWKQDGYTTRYLEETRPNRTRNCLHIQDVYSLIIFCLTINFIKLRWPSNLKYSRHSSGCQN